MANELRLSLGQTGQTVTGRLYQAAVQVGADFPLLEVAGQGGFYTGNMPAVGAGSYDVLFFANGVLRGSGNLAWSGTAELDFSTVNGSGGATAVQIRQELDTNSVKLANLDATVSSRLAAAGYTAPTIPPTAASIRAELDTNSTRLANLDATVSSRLAASGYVAAPTVVQVRQELDTNSVKLANLDATVSSRLSAAGYTAPTIPPTVALIRAELDTNSTRLANLDATISSRLAASGYVPAPTVVQVRQELDTNSVKLANLDVTVSSRLSAAGYTAPTIPPTAALIRAELDTNSTRLANLDATISSRLAASGYVAAPTVVQVRQELDTNSVKLANLDVTVSSRLAAAGYTAPTIPPTAALIRAELDTNSTRLANLDATISSRLAASGYVPAPTVVQVRQELDTNSVRLQGVVNSSDLSAATSVVLAAVGSPLQSSDYVPACSADAIASATATVLFVDGTTNRLKVNPDHSVNSSGAVGGAITNYITIPAAVAIASQSPAVITSIRGDTLRIELPLMGDLRGRTRCIMTAKRNLTDTDAQAVLQVIEGTGLTCLNGAAATSTDLAQLVITDEITGAATLVIEAPATAKLNVGDLVWDVQAMRATGIVTPISGMLTVIADVTQTIT